MKKKKIKVTSFATIKAKLSKGKAPPKQAPPKDMKTPVYAWTFGSSSSNAIYETLQYSDGSLSCDCPGWTRRPERTCKHTRSVQIGTANATALKHGPLGGKTAAPVPAAVVSETPNLSQGSFDREFS